MTRVAVDTSVAVPLLMRSHEAHLGVRQAVHTYHLVLTWHSLAETYSVLTRLPADARVAPADAASLLEANFGEPVVPETRTTMALPATLAARGIAGGAVYDALVGLTARDADLRLVTRDRRAASTYSGLDVQYTLITA